MFKNNYNFCEIPEYVLKQSDIGGIGYLILILERTKI